MPSNVLPLHLKQTLIWIFTEGEGDEIESRLPFKIFFTLCVLPVLVFRQKLEKLLQALEELLRGLVDKVRIALLGLSEGKSSSYWIVNVNHTGISVPRVWIELLGHVRVFKYVKVTFKICTRKNKCCSKWYRWLLCRLIYTSVHLRNKTLFRNWMWMRLCINLIKNSIIEFFYTQKQTTVFLSFSK